MIFTGKNLLLVRDAVVGNISDICSQIRSCPNVQFYADDLEELEADVARYEKLLARIEKAIAKEQSNDKP